jgi:ribulose-5-phosphate 4-epimerase/fuculose-1-phosphate aldolase
MNIQIYLFIKLVYTNSILRAHAPIARLLTTVQKNDIDKAMPKKVGPMRLKCMEVMGRASPIASPHQSDDDASVTEENEESQENEERIVEMFDVVQTQFSELQ